MSDRMGEFSEVTDPQRGGSGNFVRRNPDGSLVAFHLTPGYEFYRGLGWAGAIIQSPG